MDWACALPYAYLLKSVTLQTVDYFSRVGEGGGGAGGGGGQGAAPHSKHARQDAQVAMLKLVADCEIRERAWGCDRAQKLDGSVFRAIGVPPPSQSQYVRARF